MTEAFMVIGILAGLAVGGILVSFGIVNVLDPWNKKERNWGIVKLSVGVLLLLSGIGIAVTKGVEQDEFRVQCLSYGGFPYNDICYKDGVKVDLDEEGQD